MSADAFALKSVFNRHGNFGRFVIPGDVGACRNNRVILTGRPRDDQSELDESQRDLTNSGAGSEREKNRCCLDSGESLWNKATTAGASSSVATRTVAVEPSRRIKRPNSAES